jgi:hypothetical protein
MHMPSMTHTRDRSDPRAVGANPTWRFMGDPGWAWRASRPAQTTPAQQGYELFRQAKARILARCEATR